MPGFKHLHKGYEYQDIATGFCLAQSLIDTENLIIVDKKAYPSDLFDDLKVHSAETFYNYQFKFVEDESACFSVSDFNTKARSVRIDYLIESFRDDPNKEKSKYLLISTLNSPVDELLPFLELTNEEYFFLAVCIS